MPQFTATQIEMILAGLAATDQRTVRRFLGGEPTRKSVVERIELAQAWLDTAIRLTRAESSKA